MSWQHWTLLGLEALAGLTIMGNAVNEHDGGKFVTQFIAMTIVIGLLVWGQP